MNKEKLFELYCKERDYQEKIFGNLSLNPKFNIATFLLFIERYLEKSKKSYVDKWTDKLPSWLEFCNESENDSTAPVNAYEELIKIFALTGAALESYCDVDVDEWRVDGIKPKWKDVENDKK